MTRIVERADKLGALLRSFVAAVLTSEGLYLVLLLLFNSVLDADVFMRKGHIVSPLRNFVIVPWSGVLLGAYLTRERKHVGVDTWLITLLTLWIAVPFALRFGTEQATMQTAYYYALTFLTLYASVRESDAKRRARQLDIACGACCVLSLVFGGALLYCAATGKSYCSYPETFHFGLMGGQLYHGRHYNVTAMLSQVLMLMSLTGLCRNLKKPYAIVYLLGVVIMALVVVLTQSRTSRYAMLAVFAVGTWNGLCEYLPIRKALLRHGAALACAFVVLVGGYKLCGVITDAALKHYAGQPSQLLEVMLPSAIAEETQTEELAAVQEARSQAVDSTLSDRTNIWKNVFKNWKENPWHMLIGNGSGRTQWLLAKGTIHEWAGAVGAHNAYLQFASEFGMIAFGLLALFMLSILPAVLRVFFARGEKRMPGGCALCMLVLAALATGMMEDAPLEPMTAMNLALMFALGQLAGVGREMKQ